MRPLIDADMTIYQKQDLSKYLWELRHKGKSSVELPIKQEVYDELRKGISSIADEANKEGVEIFRGDDYTEIRKNPNYFPDMPSPETIATMIKGGEGEAKIKKLWIDFAMEEKNLTKSEAEDLYKAYKEGLAFRGRDLTADVEFGPMKKAAGIGLPYELIDKDPIRVLERFSNRSGAALSWIKNIQKNPAAAYILNIKNQRGQYAEPVEGLEQIHFYPETQEMVKGAIGFSDYMAHPNLAAFMRLANNIVLGTPTAVRNLVQIPNSAAPYIKSVSDIGEVVQKIMGDYSGLKGRARAAGSTRYKYTTFDIPESDIQFEPSMNPWQKFATRAARFIRKWSGRDLSDEIEGMAFHALGETLAGKEINSGNPGEFVKRFGTVVDNLETKIKNPDQFTEEDIQRIAQDFTSFIRGSYDARSLPTVALRGQIAPFLSLSRWNISKANAHLRDVVDPIKNGNWGPFIKTFLAALGVGWGIEELNQVLTGKRPQDATIKEVVAGGKEADYVEKAIDLLQLAGFMGIVSDVAKLGIRTGRGKNISYSNPLSFPAYTLVTDNIIGNIGNASAAISEGGDPFEVLAKMAVSIGAKSFQNFRALNNYLNADETERKNFFRDYRVYQEMQGLREPESSIGRGNEFQRMKEKKFKRTEDIREAKEILPELVSKEITKSRGKGGVPDIERLKKGLTRLKQTSYQTMPSYETSPGTFRSYYDYLVKTQGEQKAKERMKDFIRKKNINKVKASMVPSF